MTEQEFRNKYVGKAVHCDTEEKAKELLKLAHDFGWKWYSGEDLIKNTYWRFMEEKSCYEFNLNKRTVNASNRFYKSTGCEIVEFGSEEKKVKKTKKVFDIGLFVDNKKQRGMSLDEIMGSIKRWALECHGLTQKEVNDKNYFASCLYMKEVEVSLTKHEIEVLKALKLLDFKWIAKDRDDELYTYSSKPIKGNYSFSALGNSCYLNKDLFTFITWQDEEPTSIDELLRGENVK